MKVRNRYEKYVKNTTICYINYNSRNISFKKY